MGGYPKQQHTFARISGYCEQNDIHSPQVAIHSPDWLPNCTPAFMAMPTVARSSASLLKPSLPTPPTFTRFLVAVHADSSRFHKVVWPISP